MTGDKRGTILQIGGKGREERDKRSETLVEQEKRDERQDRNKRRKTGDKQEMNKIREVRKERNKRWDTREKR